MIEAGIITSRSHFTTDAQRDRALVSIVVAPGEQTVLNGVGDNAAMAQWDDGKVPTDAELTAFNPIEGGIILASWLQLGQPRPAQDHHSSCLRPRIS